MKRIYTLILIIETIREEMRFLLVKLYTLTVKLSQNEEFNRVIPFDLMASELKSGKSPEKISKELIENKATRFGVYADEAEAFLKFYAELGSSNISKIVSQSDYYIKLLEQRKKEATELYESKGKLCLKLGFICGALFAVVMF